MIPIIPSNISEVEMISAWVISVLNSTYVELTLIFSMKKRSIPLKMKYNEMMVPAKFTRVLNFQSIRKITEARNSS